MPTLFLWIVIVLLTAYAAMPQPLKIVLLVIEVVLAVLGLGAVRGLR